MRLIHDLQKRLGELESRLPPEQTDEEKFHEALQFFLINAAGYYLGDPQPGDAPITAFARALGGYEDQRELLKALEHGQDSEFDKKWRLAKRNLFLKFGVKNLRDAEWTEIVEAVKRMHAGLPDSYKERARIVGIESRNTPERSRKSRVFTRNIQRGGFIRDRTPFGRFIDENGGGPGVRLRKRHQKKS